MDAERNGDTAVTRALEDAIAQVRALPPDAQDAIAARLLEELKDEAAWDASFRATSSEQWAQMAAQVRKDIAAGRISSLDEALSDIDAEE